MDLQCVISPAARHLELVQATHERLEVGGGLEAEPKQEKI
jgi:hypothetical protein